MNEILVYSKDYCPYCKHAKALLHSQGLKFTEVDVGRQPERLREMVIRSGRRTVPQIFFGDQYIGGFDDLLEAHKSIPLRERSVDSAINF